jgi:hypothetical protein
MGNPDWAVYHRSQFDREVTSLSLPIEVGVLAHQHFATLRVFHQRTVSDT